MRKSSWWPTNFITYQLTLIPNKPIKHLMRRTAAFESTTYRHLPGSPITSLPSYHLTLMTFISSGRTNLLLLAPMKHATKDPLTSLSDSHQTSKQTASWSVNHYFFVLLWQNQQSFTLKLKFVSSHGQIFTQFMSSSESAGNNLL